jgi:hypothetical protein
MKNNKLNNSSQYKYLYVNECLNNKLPPKRFKDKTRFIVIIQKIFSGENVNWYTAGYCSPEVFSRAFKRWVGLNKKDLINRIKTLNYFQKKELLDEILYRINNK